MRNSVSLGLGGIPSLASGTRGNNPTINFNFALTQSLDPRITFTRATTATFTGSDGLIQTAAINAPRFAYNPTTLESLGLLIEEQRANLVTYSDQFSNAAWAKTNATITPNTTASPDGTVNADTLTDDVIVGQHQVGQTVAVTSGTSYLLSAYVKKDTQRYARLSMGGAAMNFAAASFDLDLGVSVTGVAVSTITPVGNSWYRISLISSASSSGNGVFTIGQTNAAATIYSGTGSTLFVWGAQLEAGAFATSYIPTVASQVTRSADFATMTGTNFSSWYNPTEGTMFVEAQASLNVSATYAIINNGITDTERFYFDNAAGNMRNVTFSSGAAVSILNLGAIGTTGVFNKLIGVYKVNDFAASKNGGAVVTDTSGNVPINPTQLTFGRIVSGAPSAFINSTIKQIAYYPQRLPNSQLQALTA